MAIHVIWAHPSPVPVFIRLVVVVAPRHHHCRQLPAVLSTPRTVARGRPLSWHRLAALSDGGVGVCEREGSGKSSITTNACKQHVNNQRRRVDIRPNFGPCTSCGTLIPTCPQIIGNYYEKERKFN